MLVAVKPWGGVAQAVVPRAKAPTTQARTAPATVSLRGIVRLALLAARPNLWNRNMPSLLRSALGWKGIVPGAQTGRRGGAGPAGACLVVRTLPTTICVRAVNRR